MIVAIDLAPALKRRGRHCHDDDDDDDDDIWPALEEPCLLPSPWQSLPLDLLFYSVLVRLPFPVLLDLRRVSRSWCRRLSSHDFWFRWFQGNQPYSSQFQNVSRNPNLLQNLSPRRIPNSPNSIEHDPSSHSNRNLNPHRVFDIVVSKFSPDSDNYPVPCLLLCSAKFKASPGYQAMHWLRKRSIRYVQQQYTASTHRISQYWSQLQESFMQVQEPYIILASDGGLVLLATGIEGSQQLIVCNPLLRAHKVVHNSVFPSLTDMSATAMGFIADKEHGEYRVILASAGFHVYNSSSGHWQMVSPLLFKSSASASPPILDGSSFWLSSEKTFMNSNDESILYVYHPDVEVITRVSTHFPQGVSFPNCGRVWKESSGLQTLAWSSTWFGIWTLDNGLWKRTKELPFSQQFSNLRELDFVKVDNLLLLRFSKFDQVYVFDMGLSIGAFTPGCAHSKYLTGHCVFQPSCIQV